MSNLEMPDHGIIRGGRFLVRFQALAHLKLHIRLPGTDPDIADEHAFQEFRLAILSDDHLEGPPAVRGLRAIFQSPFSSAVAVAV